MGMHFLTDSTTADDEAAQRDDVDVVTLRRESASLPQGRHTSRFFRLTGVHLERVHRATPRLAFLSATDAQGESLELVAKQRDGFLAEDDISQLCTAAERRAEASMMEGFVELEAVSGEGELSLFFHLSRIRIELSDGVLELPNTCRAAAMATVELAPKTKNHGSKQHGANNANRAPLFVRWLLSVFPLGRLCNGVILDVAGGSGQVSFELACRYRCPSVIVDPRAAHISSKQKAYFARAARDAVHRHGAVFRTATATGGTAIAASAQAVSPAAEFAAAAQVCGVSSDVPLPRQLLQLFDEGFGSAAPTQQLWADATLVVGMHPDEATEPIVDACLRAAKPFAIVPCCVFPTSNAHRRLADGQPVRSHEEFCLYLRAKHPAIMRTELPFAGRNTVLYYLGAEDHADHHDYLAAAQAALPLDELACLSTAE